MNEPYLQCQCLARVPGERCARQADAEDGLCGQCRVDEDCVQARREALRRAPFRQPRLA